MRIYTLKNRPLPRPLPRGRGVITNEKRETTMYQLYKDDMWGHKVPFMVATKPFADQLVRDLKREITRVVDVPRNVQALIKM